MRFSIFVMAAGLLSAQPYDLLIKGGTVIDPKNGVNARMDVAITAGRIARVAADIPAADAKRVANAAGLYVAPGLIDLHVHVATRPGTPGLTGNSSVHPDGFSFRTGVTTMVDAGTTGHKNFPDFHDRIIKQSRTRVLALLNIVAGGMGPDGEDNPDAMDAKATAAAARAYPDVVVGFKTAHYNGEGWHSVDRAVEAGKITNLPVMVDFGYTTEERNLGVLLRDKLRPGDIYTHCYSGHRDELLASGQTNPAMTDGRRRGIFFDVGHGGGSFYWNIATPLFEQKFYPDSISTDLHTGSMNAGMKDMANVMSKVLIAGVPLAEVVRMSTWQPAQQIKRTDLGHLSVGAEADVAVLGVEKGNFGFIDSAGASREGSQRIIAEITVRKGRVEWDLNGRAATNWKQFPYRKRENPK
jgi:dihydroorotase